MGAAPALAPDAGGGGGAEVPVRPLRALTSRAVLAVALAAATPLAAAPLRAQSACDGRPIRSIQVRSLTLFAPGDPDVLGVARAVGRALHKATREDVVRHDLLFQVGDPCDPRRLAETARLLRSEPYIREAVVTPVPNRDGGVDIVLRTRDEWSLRVSGRVRQGEGFPLRQAKVSEENLFGSAVRVQLHYDLLRRDPAYDADVTAHQFLGQYEGQVIAGRSSVGLLVEQRLLSPFRSEYDRLAWRESGRYRHEPFTLNSPVFGRVDQPVLAVSTDFGVAVRAGTPGRLLVGGAAFSAERLLADGAPLAARVVDDSAAGAALAGRFTERRRIRLHVFAGARALRFHPHVGIDAVSAYEDVREGIELGVVGGKSLFGGSGLQRDWFASGELFAGADLSETLVFLRGKVEGRYLLAERRWDGVLADGRILVYTQLGPRSFAVISAGGSGGWETRTPFQLLLAGPDGIRGYGLGAMPVGRRVVVQGEQRQFLGSVLGVADVGTAVFVDVGRGWAGDAPFGLDTGVRAAVGAGLRIAVPRGSRRTYRVDVAVPLTGGHVEVQVALNQLFGVFRGESSDVARSREQVSSTSIFNYPRF